MAPHPGPHERLAEEKVLFALAQHGLTALWRLYSASAHSPQLWVPDYYCPPVVESWQQAGIPITRYADDPRWADPDWGTLRPETGDLVLAVNFFGLREGRAWLDWTVDHRNIRVVEDHSHDPFSAWARDSTADYAIGLAPKDPADP